MKTKAGENQAIDSIGRELSSGAFEFGNISISAFTITYDKEEIHNGAIKFKKI